jgi:hypothetical protein
MYKTISNKVIRQFHIGYDPSEVITDETEELPVKDWVQKYRHVIPAKNIICLLLREEFLSKKDLRLFAVWCAREALKLIANPDERSINACNIAEKFANGQATKKELDAAYIAADTAAEVAYFSTHGDFYTSNINYASYYAALSASKAADSDCISHSAYTAAYYASYAAFKIASVPISYTSNADYATTTATNNIIYDIVRTSQLNKLLTYFE